MTTTKPVVGSASCGNCGDDVEITTTERQRDGYEWYALEGDEGHCVSCGAVHQVQVNDDEHAVLVEVQS